MFRGNTKTSNFTPRNSFTTQAQHNANHRHIHQTIDFSNVAQIRQFPFETTFLLRKLKAAGYAYQSIAYTITSSVGKDKYMDPLLGSQENIFLAENPTSIKSGFGYR